MSVSLAERDEDRHTRAGPYLARAVALAGPVLRDEDVAGAEAPHGAVADLDVHRPRQREHGVAARRVVPGIGALRIEAAHDDATAGNQLRGLGLVAPRLEAHLHVLEVRLAIGAAVDANDRHVPSRGRGIWGAGELQAAARAAAPRRPTSRTVSMVRAISTAATTNTARGSPRSISHP